MPRLLIWDLPTRLFHGLFALSFLAAFALATLVDDDAPAFRYHMLLGLGLTFLVALRLIWGLVGTRWARLRSLSLSPRALVAYLRGVVTGDGPRHDGHNPATSIAMLVMFASAIGLAITGVQMSGGSDAWEDVHEVLAWTFMATVGLHVVGIALHTLRHREPLALSMIDGRKQASPDAAIAGSLPLAGLAMLALVGAWGAALLVSYDSTSGQVTLPLTGPTLLLGDADDHDGHDDKHDDHDDDHDDD